MLETGLKPDNFLPLAIECVLKAQEISSEKQTQVELASLIAKVHLMLYMTLSEQVFK